ncbi:MAG: 2-phosphosulfolactate phosphatase [Prevotellaceae bacterium]|jgi:2-phosphosulfolactate phosphatase|nr:2-phosphosulfolactate phosphatase [Prevotellaceae bacterium]
MPKPQIEVCFSPLLYEKYHNEHNIVVVCDILRATTSICTALGNGATEVIPVRSVEEARKYKERGYILAGERDGKTLDFADFGNSPFNFTPERVKGKPVAYSTTNGTKAVFLGKDSRGVIVGAFINLMAVARYLMRQQQNVLVLCAGWKGKFCLEDSIFAGALAEILIKDGAFAIECDATNAALDLWSIAKQYLMEYVQKMAQRERLRKLGLDDVLDFCFTLNTSDIVPVLKEDRLIPVKL